MQRPRSIVGMAVNKQRCKTCPFNGDGDREIRNAVEERCITLGSQLCHGTDNKTLCRGARDHQLTIFHRMGMLTAPTQEAWDELAEAIAKTEKHHKKYHKDHG